MTSTWRRVIRLAVEWSRERVGIWLKTAWSGQGCAGCHPERKRCWTYEPPTSMASGMPSGTSTSRRRMNGFTAKYGRLGEVNPVVTPNSIATSRRPRRLVGRLRCQMQLQESRGRVEFALQGQGYQGSPGVLLWAFHHLRR